jgi:hypothetical protein
MGRWKDLRMVPVVTGGCGGYEFVRDASCREVPGYDQLGVGCGRAEFLPQSLVRVLL